MQRRRRRRGGLSAAEQQELWQRWRHGESLNAIARALDRPATVVRRVVAETGGFTPVRRCRSPRVLSLAEREEISRGVAAGEPARQIARRLGRAPSTVCRELARHGGRAGYRAAGADAAAWQRARRPQALQTDRCSAPAPPGSGEAAAGLVARANRWLASAYVPAGRAAPRVPRDDLPQFVHPGPAAS